MKRTLLLALLALMLLPAAVAQIAGSSPAILAQSPGVGPDYLIGADDILHISVWREPEMTTTVPVRPDGKISLPLIGEVEAAGLTPTALQQSITTKAEKFVTNPQVTVMVTDVRSKRVYVVGEVMRPGSYSVAPGMTALQAITAAGGLNQYANSRKIFIMRKENGNLTRLLFNYHAVVSGRDLNADIAIKAGDTLIVR